MELRYKHEAGVGILIVVAAILFVLLMMWLRGRSFREGEVVRAVFEDVAGLKEGDLVRTSGVTVGQIKSVELGGPGEVQVAFTLKKAPAPMADASATIRALDFFGARFIEYAPGRSTEPLDRSRPLRGTRAADLSEMAAGLGDPARQLLGNAGELISPNTTRDLRLVLVEARRTLEALGNAAQAPSRELTGALSELRRVFQRLDLMMASNEQSVAASTRSLRELSGNLALATANLSHTTAALDSVIGKINSGRGALGALVNDSTLIADLRRTNSALADLLVDFKANPGRYIRLRL